MSVDVNRRAFLRGCPKAASVDIAPPWSNHESLESHCNRCGDCISVCPENIIVIGDGRFPKLDFSQGECSFCGKCSAVCNEGVFDNTQIPVLKALAEVVLASCLPEKGVHCEACRDSCSESAISMEMRIGLPPKPQISASKCSGCGACYEPCPANAINLIPLSQDENLQGNKAYG